MKIIKNLKIWWHKRKTIERAIEDENPKVLAAFLEKYPKYDKKIAELALLRCKYLATRDSLLLGLGLIMADSDCAVEVLRKFIDHNKEPVAREYPICWDRIPLNQLKSVFGYLRKRTERTLASELGMQLPVEQYLQVMPHIGDEEFLLALSIHLKNSRPIDHITDYLTSYLEQLALSGMSGSADVSIALENCVRATIQIWNANKIDDAIDILTTLSLVQPHLIQEDLLIYTAGMLQNFVRGLQPRLVLPESLRISYDYISSNYPKKIDPRTGLSVIRAVNLLRRFPSPEWLPILKSSWLEFLELARVNIEASSNEEYHSNKIDPHTEAITHALAIALGVCAIYDESYTTLETETPKSRQRDQLVQHLNRLVEEHNALIRDYLNQPQSDHEVADQIIKLKDEINTLKDQIEEIDRNWMEHLSPGYLLFLVLQDKQAYSAYVRQGAAWGLWRLCENGNLDESSRKRISEEIRSAIFEFDEAKIRDWLYQILPDEETLRQKVLDASLDYFYTRNFQHFWDLLSTLRLGDDLTSRIVTMVRSFTYQELSHHFRERCIQFFPGMRLMELEQTLIDGLVWMSDLLESFQADETTTEDDGDFLHIREIIKLLHEIMPNVLDFLARYPLRLMTLEQHKRILGQYSRTRSDVTLWTRYTPPLWRRGASPGEVGVVRSRYLELDDRSFPNAMGIYYRLFRHPVLALPVIYHEYLHYGGPTGDANRGIENETEVLLREIIFARGLIAKLAPPDDEKIPEFERELVHEIKAAGLDGLGFQLVALDLQDDNMLEAICDQIEHTYGKHLTPDEAVREITNLIAFCNRHIQLANQTDEMKRNWFPEIEWPYLDTDRTRDLTQEYQQILYRSFTTDHRIDASRRDCILNDPACRECLEAWEAYRRRKKALVEFNKIWSIESVHRREFLEFILNRTGPISSISDEFDEESQNVMRILRELFH